MALLKKEGQQRTGINGARPRAIGRILSEALAASIITGCAGNTAEIRPGSPSVDCDSMMLTIEQIEDCQSAANGVVMTSGDSDQGRTGSPDPRITPLRSLTQWQNGDIAIECALDQSHEGLDRITARAYVIDSPPCEGEGKCAVASHELQGARLSLEYLNAEGGGFVAMPGCERIGTDGCDITARPERPLRFRVSFTPSEGQSMRAVSYEYELR
ncbi:MAG: hypothetical protein U0R44_04330 [Candidatus Micrarchaeia archaeon]